MRGEKGITLVALVVTIVVLLILAGITISYVLADGGIFTRAQNAEKDQVKGYISDYASSAQGEFLLAYYQDGEAAATSAMPTIITSNFPTGYTADPTAKGTGSAAVSVSGRKLVGSYTVTTTVNNTSVVYTVTYDANGVVSVSY